MNLKSSPSRVRVRAHYSDFRILSFTTFTEIVATNCETRIYRCISDIF